MSSQFDVPELYYKIIYKRTVFLNLYLYYIND